MTSEASIPEPPTIFIYNKDTKDADIPNNVTHVKVDPSVKEIHNKAFIACQTLVEVEFSEGLQVIGRKAFWDCQNLKHINKFPSTLKETHYEAFWCCSSLDSIEFPEGLQVIGDDAFALCRALKRIKIPSAHLVIGERAFAECTCLVSVELPEGLQAIGTFWFGYCTSLTTVNVPSSVIEIQDSAFADCTSLASLDLPEGLQSIGCQSFASCESLATLHIPSTVCKIGASAFACCRQLMSVHLLGNLRTIEEGTFRACDFLTHVRIPSSVTRIERAAFAHCTRLMSLELPEGLEMIDLDLGSFVPSDRSNIYECRSLVNLVVPSEQRFQQPDGYYDEQFMKGLKLRHVASSFTDLVSKLQHRFDDLPVHRLCYYQSYYPLMEAMENLRQSMYADPAAGNKVDAFGITPFHILALSQTPNLSLFQALMKVCKVDTIRTKDKFGSNPIDYLCMNHIPASAAVLQSLLPTIFAERVGRLGLVRWKSDMVDAMDEALAVEWPSRRREIRLLYFKLATYERLESVSLLELALWKVKIDSCKAAYDTDHERGEECRRGLDWTGRI
jgi:hypothetical protein